MVSGLEFYPPPTAPHSPAVTCPVAGESFSHTLTFSHARTMRPSPPLRYNIILVAATLVCIGLWIVPSFVPSREPLLTSERVEQNARLNLYLTSLRVREYVAVNRKLPASLAEVGVDSIGVGYARGARTEFELSMRVNGMPVVFKSTVPDSVFLGANLRVRGIS